MATLFSTRRALEEARFYSSLRIPTGHRLLGDAIYQPEVGSLWVVRGPHSERTSVIDGIAAAGLEDRRAISYVSMHLPSSEVGLRVVATAAGTTPRRLVEESADEETLARALELSETRLMDVVGATPDIKAGLSNCTPHATRRALDLLIIDGVDVAPQLVIEALGIDDFAKGEANWVGALRAYARQRRTTVLIGTATDVRDGKPDPDIGDRDVLIDVGWYQPQELEFPVTVTSGRYRTTRLFASPTPFSSKLAWRAAADRE